MKESQRSQIRDTARYLQSVRPIDPEEIFEYVEGSPHPSAVRTVLREEAPELGLVEREDGSFEPAGTGPLDPSFDGITSLPEPICHRLEDSLVERFGPGWPDEESGERLRERIRSFKERYFRGESVTYDEVTALGYAIYHLPVYYATVQYVFAELAAHDLLPPHLRILDVGAGVGGPALGIDAFVPADALVEYHAVEPSEATALLRTFLGETGRNFHSTVHESTIEAFEPAGEYDVVLCANVLSELADPVGVLGGLLESLSNDGTAVLIEPADRNTATNLRRIERALEAEGATVHSPAVRLWPGVTPTGECWSFTKRPDLEVPPFQRRLDEGDGKFINVDVQYAYSLLRTDGRRQIQFTPSESRFARFERMAGHVTERIDCVAVKLSHDLSDGGNPLYLVGDGSEQVDHYAVLTDPSSLNESLESAAYGDLLFFENVLVLWNDDEGAYNLVVDGETVIDTRSV